MTRCFFIVLFGLGPSVFANIDLRTNIEELTINSPHEIAGTILFSANGGDLSQASPDNQHFIRVRFAHMAVLAETLVDFDDGDSHKHHPILVPLVCTSAPIVAPIDTVSIVRWVKGESEFWIRVNHSSDQWLRNEEGELFGPDLDHPVSWSIGKVIDGNDPSKLVEWEGANLSRPQRMDGTPVEIQLTLDLDQSMVNAMDVLPFDTIAFQHVTLDGDNGLYTALPNEARPYGIATSVNFSGDYLIGRFVEANGNGGAFPWVSKSVQFVSSLHLTNPTTQAGEVSLNFYREGEVISTRDLEIPALANTAFNLADLGNDLTGGFSVKWESAHEGILASMQTATLSHSSGYCEDIKIREAWTSQVFPTQSSSSIRAVAMALLNPGEQSVEVTVFQWSPDQISVVEKLTLDPWSPRTVLIPDFEAESLAVQSMAPIMGQLFQFTDHGDLMITKGESRPLPIPSYLTTSSSE